MDKIKLLEGKAHEMFDRYVLSDMYYLNFRDFLEDFGFSRKEIEIICKILNVK